MVRFEKTNRRHKEEALRADPDVESGSKELIMLKRLYHTFENALRNRCRNCARNDVGRL